MYSAHDSGTTVYRENNNFEGFFQFKLNAFLSASRVLSCVNALNNGEIFLLRGFAEKLLGPSLYRFLATLSQPVQVSATG